MEQPCDPNTYASEPASEIKREHRRRRSEGDSNCSRRQRRRDWLQDSPLHLVAQAIKRIADLVCIIGKPGSRVLQGLLEAFRANEGLKPGITDLCQHCLIEVIPLAGGLELSDCVAQRILNPGHPAFEIVSRLLLRREF